MPDTQFTDNEIIDAYLENSRTLSKDTFWAFEEVLQMTWKDPDRAWRMTLEMISRAEDQITLCYIAAGPLEDLLKNHPDSFFDRTLLLAQTDKKLHQALLGVWGLKPELNERIKQLS